MSMSASKRHTSIVSGKGEVWVWGSGLTGQLGAVGVNTYVSPQRVLGGIKRKIITSISCSGHHTLALSNDGLLYAWGE